MNQINILIKLTTPIDDAKLNILENVINIKKIGKFIFSFPNRMKEIKGKAGIINLGNSKYM